MKKLLVKALELRIHPPIIFLLSVGISYLFSQYLPILDLQGFLKTGYIFFIILGFVFPLTGLYQFYVAKTTVDPVKPDKTTKLVTNGIYAHTRNPMYLGMATVLIGVCFKFNVLSSFAGLFFFVVYITTFQIKPEEKAIEALFGEKYLEYKKQVRRWI